MLNNIIEKVKIRGDILLGKVYGYTDRYTQLKECLLSNLLRGPLHSLRARPRRTIWTFSW